MTAYTQEIGDRVCDLISDGMSLRAIATQDGMPSASTVCKWLADDGNLEFRKQYARAREAQADKIFDEILDIADSQEGDIITMSDGREVVNHDAIARAKLRIDARKWMAGKLRPKVYGDKMHTELSGPNGGPIQTHETSARDLIASKLNGLAARSGTSTDIDEPNRSTS